MSATKVILGLLVIGLFAGCTGPQKTPAPATPAPTTAAPEPQVQPVEPTMLDKVWIEDPETVKAIYVKDYGTKEYIDAKTANYVKGSDVKGPMGDDLVPFASSDDAAAFVHEHGGEVIAYEDITKDLLKGLKMKMGGMEAMDTGDM